MIISEIDNKNILETTSQTLDNSKNSFEKVDDFFDDFILFELHGLLEWVFAIDDLEDLKE